MVAFADFKSCTPAFWSLPNLFLTDAAAAGSIGLINSMGNLGGFLWPTILGYVNTATGSFVDGLYCLCAFMIIFDSIILSLGLGKRQTPP